MNRSLLYIESLENERVKDLMLEAFYLIKSLIPQIQCAFKWRTPFFLYRNKHFCYLNFKQEKIYFSFFNMTEQLTSTHFQIDHLKHVSKIYISNHTQLRNQKLAELIIQAVMIHEANLDAP